MAESLDDEMDRDLWPAFKRYRKAVDEYRAAKEHLRYFTDALNVTINPINEEIEEYSSSSNNSRSE